MSSIVDRGYMRVPRAPYHRDHLLYPTKSELKQPGMTRRDAFMELLFTAAYQSSSGFKEGEFEMTARFLSEMTGWGHSKAGDFLLDLQALGYIRRTYKAKNQKDKSRYLIVGYNNLASVEGVWAPLGDSDTRMDSDPDGARPYSEPFVVSNEKSGTDSAGDIEEGIRCQEGLGTPSYREPYRERKKKVELTEPSEEVTELSEPRSLHYRVDDELQDEIDRFRRPELETCPNLDALQEQHVAGERS